MTNRVQITPKYKGYINLWRFPVHIESSFSCTLWHQRTYWRLEKLDLPNKLNDKLSSLRFSSCDYHRHTTINTNYFITWIWIGSLGFIKYFLYNHIAGEEPETKINMVGIEETDSLFCCRPELHVIRIIYKSIHFLFTIRTLLLIKKSHFIQLLAISQRMFRTPCIRFSPNKT